MRVTRNLWGYSHKRFIYCTRRKSPAGRNFGFLLPEKLKNCILNEKLNTFFFYEGFLSRTLTPHKIAGEGRGPFFIPPYHSHPLANIQTFIYNFCMWDDYHMFLILPLVFTRLLLKEIYQLIELPFDWLMMRYWLLLVLLQLFDMRNRWTRIRIDYHPCITSKPTNQ